LTVQRTEENTNNFSDLSMYKEGLIQVSYKHLYS
jgi:hypothetical protein